MKLLRLLLLIYKNSFSVIFRYLFGKGCKYNVTCSEYTVIQIEKHGFIRGGLKGFKRVLKCNNL